MILTGWWPEVSGNNDEDYGEDDGDECGDGDDDGDDDSHWMVVGGLMEG